MAEALLGIVVENLASLVQNEFATLSGIKSKAQNLSTTLPLIKAVLEQAEEKQVTERSTNVWLQQLRDAVYVLDDILDECSIESSRLRGLSSLKPKNLKFRHDIGSKLIEIKSRLDQIAENKNKFLPREVSNVRERPTEVAEWRQTSSIIAEPVVFGREDDKEKIVEFLLTQARDSDFLSVYPIIGLGGVGKTTLMQLVYKDHRVTNHFNLKIWVCVSETFSVNRIICSIIESITNEKCDAFDSDVLQKKLQGLLQGKIYFLVLDDVWNTNPESDLGLSQEKWKKLKKVLSSGSKGSSILVSTRDSEVSVIMRTCQVHTLFGLSDNDCWLLFKQYAFGNGKEERAELVEIGMEIVKKCGGLPLAAQALGGLMHSRSEVKEWLEIKESKIWALPHEKSILPALMLSYIHLSPTLKQCFAFCAMFPKDTEILKEELVHLWMANGFISSRENLDVENVGNMIWNELRQKSFFQDIQVDDYSGNVSFKMHDLVHDLAQSVTGQECITMEKANMTNLSSSTHHISFNPAQLLSFDESSFKKVESLRTLFQMSSYGHYDFVYFPTNCSLRVLCTSIFQVLSSLGSLIHLRYLELHDFDTKTLPDSICSLKKLEILKIINFEKLSCLPKGLVCLQNLRHLIITHCYRLSNVFPHIRKLSCLRTLSVYIVSLENGHSLSELCDLKLGGKLEIKGLEKVGSVIEARGAKLMSKKDLRILCLSWESNDDISETPSSHAEQVLEELQPHSNLKGLKIKFYEGLCLPSWMVNLSNLDTLELSNCDNYVRLPALGKLPLLKNLQLESLKNLQYMDDDDESHGGMEVTVFPFLENLTLKYLPNLERVLKVERGKMFPCLSSLTIEHCPKLGLRCLPSLKELYVIGCNNELLRSISSFCGLSTLFLTEGNGITSFPEGMFRNLTCLKDLTVNYFPKLKELSNEPFNLALESLNISSCQELESLPEKIWEGLQSLQTMRIDNCTGLRCLPKGIRNLTSLEVLRISHCPILKERCKEGTGEDWDKIAHIPKLMVS